MAPTLATAIDCRGATARRRSRRRCRGALRLGDEVDLASPMRSSQPCSGATIVRQVPGCRGMEATNWVIECRQRLATMTSDESTSGSR